MPAVDGSYCNKSAGAFTVALVVRFDKLPPKGHLQSLLRFSMPDPHALQQASASKTHRTAVYLNSDGFVVGRPIISGGGVEALTAMDADVSPPASATVTIVAAEPPSSIDSVITHAVEAKTTSVVAGNDVVAVSECVDSVVKHAAVSAAIGAETEMAQDVVVPADNDSVSAAEPIAAGPIAGAAAVAAAAQEAEATAMAEKASKALEKSALLKSLPHNRGRLQPKRWHVILVSSNLVGKNK